MKLILPLKTAFDRISLLYTRELDLDIDQLELSQINLTVNLIIACNAIAKDKGLSDKPEINVELDRLPVDFSLLTVPGKTNNTFKVCSSKDEASKLFLELTDRGVTVDSQEMETTECDRLAVVQGILNIRYKKYLNFISSSQTTLGLDGSIALKISQDTLGKDEAKYIYNQLVPIISILIKTFEEAL